MGKTSAGLVLEAADRGFQSSTSLPERGCPSQPHGMLASIFLPPFLSNLQRVFPFCLRQAWSEDGAYNFWIPPTRFSKCPRSSIMEHVLSWFGLGWVGCLILNKESRRESRHGRESPPDFPRRGTFEAGLPPAWRIDPLAPRGPGRLLFGRFTQIVVNKLV